MTRAQGSKTVRLTASPNVTWGVNELNGGRRKGAKTGPEYNKKKKKQKKKKATGLVRPNEGPPNSLRKEKGEMYETRPVQKVKN